MVYLSIVITIDCWLLLIQETSITQCIDPYSNELLKDDRVLINVLSVAASGVISDVTRGYHHVTVVVSHVTAVVIR